MMRRYEKDVTEFIKSCIHCVRSLDGERTPRPISIALHGEVSNKVIHPDFEYMSPANKRELKYVLVIEDELNSNTWLWPFCSADSDAAIYVLSNVFRVTAARSGF